MLSANQIVEKLQSIVGSSKLSWGDTLAERAVSYWDSSATQAIALVKPDTVEALSRVMALCNELGQRVVIQGGLTGCVEGAVPRADEVIVSLENLNQIEDIDPLNSTATVQAGVILENIQNAAREQGLIFPLDLGARGSCTIGGNIATNAGGINVLRYGMVRNLVLGLEVVLADGTVVSSMNQMLKNNAGYDIKQMFIGSEGTLGIITRAVLKLYPEPVSNETALIACSSYDDTVELLSYLKSSLAGTLSSFEVMWGEYYDTVTTIGGHHLPLERGQPFYVIVEADGADPELDRQRFETTMERCFNKGVLQDAVICKSESERQSVWRIREDFELIMPAHLYDISLPIGGMDQYVTALKNALLEKWPEAHCHVFGHIADGNLHLFINSNDPDEASGEADEIVYTLLAEWAGSVSAEHGIGTEKMGWLKRSRSDSEYKTMQLLKNSLDPDGLLNHERVL